MFVRSLLTFKDIGLKSNKNSNKSNNNELIPSKTYYYMKDSNLKTIGHDTSFYTTKKDEQALDFTLSSDPILTMMS